MNPVEEYLDNMLGESINPNFMINDSRFHYQAEDYRKRGIRGNSVNFEPLNKILFKPDHTLYGIVLQGPKKGDFIDAAVLGFNLLEGEVSDCLEIHGGRGMYGQLTPIMWARELLTSLVNLSRQTGLRSVQVIPAINIDGVDGGNYERLVQRYDYNARGLGFVYSKEQQRLILDL